MKPNHTQVVSVALTLVASLALAGCTAQVDAGADGWTKDAAREAGGRDDDGRDICALEGWYDDGVCDDFCVQDDGDCPVSSCPDPDAPGVVYIGESLSACMAMLYACDPGTTYFMSEACGCGCVPIADEPLCGGTAGVLCPSDMVCDRPDGQACGDTDATGVCRTRDVACPELWAPVCGCDGETYSSECNALSAGTDVLHAGECGSGSECGGFLGLTCGLGEYCHYEIGDYCGGDDSLGECRPKPEVCAEIYAPVCGCDGQTYENECSANGAGVSAFSAGACSSN